MQYTGFPDDRPLLIGFAKVATYFKGSILEEILSSLSHSLS